MWQPKITVVIAEKRHHIRFFPPAGTASDKNGNPVPGVIVDRDVTTPFDNDIYLCSHAAIQGTARPTHYTIIMDEIGVDVDRFQAMLYEHCYQYQRATTPVSLCKSHPSNDPLKLKLTNPSPCGLLCPLGLEAWRITYRYGG